MAGGTTIRDNVASLADDAVYVIGQAVDPDTATLWFVAGLGVGFVLAMAYFLIRWACKYDHRFVCRYDHACESDPVFARSCPLSPASCSSHVVQRISSKT